MLCLEPVIIKKKVQCERMNNWKRRTFNLNIIDIHKSYYYKLTSIFFVITHLSFFKARWDDFLLKTKLLRLPLLFSISAFEGLQQKTPKLLLMMTYPMQRISKNLLLLINVQLSQTKSRLFFHTFIYYYNKNKWFMMGKSCFKENKEQSRPLLKTIVFKFQIAYQNMSF